MRLIFLLKRLPGCNCRSIKECLTDSIHQNVLVMKFKKRRDRSPQEYENLFRLISTTSSPKFKNQLARAKEEMPELYQTYNHLYTLVMQLIEDSYKQNK